MTLDDALTIVIARTGHERYRWLTSDANPDATQRDGYRASILRQAGAPAPPVPAPSGPTSLGNCCGGAVGYPDP